MDKILQELEEHFKNTPKEELEREWEEITGNKRIKELKNKGSVEMWVAVNRRNMMFAFEEKPTYMDMDSHFCPDTWLVAGCTMGDSDYGLSINKSKYSNVLFENSPIKMAINTEHLIEE